MEQYLNLCKNVLEQGEKKQDRTGTGTISYFGHQMRFDLQEGFPMMTTKKIPFRIIAEELLWFIRGDTNVGSLVDKNVHIWNQDAHRGYVEKAINQGIDPLPITQFVESIKDSGTFRGFFGDLGPIYGAQWRSWPHPEGGMIDQLGKVIQGIKENPHSRRHVVSAWNPGELDQMTLPPCHILFQFYVSNGKLSCQLYQRSGDVFLGVPFNIASYSLLTHMVAQITGYEVGEFIHTLGDAHIYLNHVDQVNTQLQRIPKRLPRLYLNPEVAEIDDFTMEDLVLNGYNPEEVIKGNLST